MQARYRDALLRAAFDLQSRLYNILNGFLQSYHGRSERHRSYAEDSTIWLIGQYLGWVEAMRRDAQFLDLGSVRSARRLELALGRVRDAFGSDRKISDPLLRIFRVDQRALGELMLAEENRKEAPTRCIGYTEFRGRLGDAGVRHVSLRSVMTCENSSMRPSPSARRISSRRLST
jgi:hypothetical protein